MAQSSILQTIEERISRARPPEAEARAAGSGVAVSRYAEGLTDETELRGELRALGYTGDREDNLVLQAQLRRELELYRDRLALLRQQQRAGDISLSQFLSGVEALGLSAEAVELERRRAESAAPAPVRRAVQISLGLLDVQEVPPRPAEQPVQITLGVLEAAQVAAPASSSVPVALTLSVLEADVVPEPAPVQAVQIGLAILTISQA